jgi:hypothetical protein
MREINYGGDRVDVFDLVSDHIEEVAASAVGLSLMEVRVHAVTRAQ